GEGRIYLARNGAEKSVDLYRIDPATGHPISRPDGRLCVHVKDTFQSRYLGGIAELGGTLYAADTDGVRVLFDTVDRLSFSSAVDIPEPRSPAADRKRNLVWLVSANEKVLALDATGRRVHEFSGVKKPLALTVASDTLAVASAETGKIHFYEITDPSHPQSIVEKTLGRGDGPFGKWLPDRFHFQSHPRNVNRGKVSLALADNGLLTVRDSSGRVVTFAADGKPVHPGFAVWGGDPCFAAFAGDPRPRVFDTNACVSYFLDANSGKWEPDAYWGLPPMTQPSVRGFFSIQGKNFGVFTCRDPDQNVGESIVIASYDDPVVRTVAMYRRNPAGGYLVALDTNNDGVIDDQDEPGTSVVDTEGKAVTRSLSGRFMFVNPDGTIYHSGHQLALIWRCKGLDARGVPIYEFTNQMVLAPKDPIVPSPYFAGQTEDLRCASTARYIAQDGGICAGINLRHTLQGMGLSNSGATDLARWSSDGTLRWLRTTNDYSPIQGVAVFPDLILSSWGHQCEFMALDGDGLELGRFGLPAAANWNGFWVDHPQEWSAIRSDDGDVQLVIGDYMTNCHHWLTIRHTGAVRKSRVPVVIRGTKVRELAYRIPVL
ncbi:MAG: PQQ-like beta-propeller repeat protein, partial [Planctomycetes bacterium]|nr:PQQ-like beta-propeller repeat protein [Planctomycetota bacterium]